MSHIQHEKGGYKCCPFGYTSVVDRIATDNNDVVYHDSYLDYALSSV